MIRLAIVDDQRLVYEGLEALINMRQDMKCVATFRDGKEVVDNLSSYEVDVILMDIRMPVMDGIEATRYIREQDPHVRILMLTTFNDDELIIESMRAGANGYTLKDMPIEKLVEAIHTVQKEGAYLLESLTSTVIQSVRESTSHQDYEKSWIEKYQLTEREVEIVSYIKQGLSNADIASQLYITPGTVKNHLSNLMDKLELRERNHITIYALTGKRPNDSAN